MGPAVKSLLQPLGLVVILFVAVSCSSGERHVASIVHEPMRVVLPSFRLGRCTQQGCFSVYRVRVTNRGHQAVYVEECRLSAFNSSGRQISQARLVVDPIAGLYVPPSSTKAGSGVAIWRGIARPLILKSRSAVSCQAWEWHGGPPV